MLQVAPDLCMVCPEQATLLGSAIGGAAGVDSSIHTKTKALEVMGSRLCPLQAHDAYCLLSTCICSTQSTVHVEVITMLPFPKTPEL